MPISVDIPGKQHPTFLSIPTRALDAVTRARHTTARLSDLQSRVTSESRTMRTHGSGGAPLPAGAHPAETLSLLGGSRGHSARQGCVAVCVSPSVSDAADARAAAARPRSRVVALAAGAVFALFALAALASAHDGFRAFGSDAVASLGRGSKSSASAPRAAATSAAGDDDWLLGGADEPSLGAFAEVSGSESSETSSPRRGGSSSRRGGSPSSSSSGGALRNVEGGVPGLVAHVDAATDTTRFRMISFCNQAYWPFAHGMLQSMQFTAPTLVPFWTVIVADEETKAFIEKQAPGVDVFVDVDLQRIVSDADAADVGDLKKLLSWRRMHALYGLIQADYTAVFLEPDVVFTKNPLQLFHDMLLDADIVATSDYGFGAEAVRRVNTKVLFAKPSDEAKKLLDVWQRAEAAYEGEDAERGFLVNEILPNADRMEAAIHVLDQKTVANYLSHDASSRDAPTIITGTGCDDVNYKLNWMNQMVLQVLPAGPEGPPRVDYETVREGCDYRTRAEATRGKNENENGAGLNPGTRGEMDAPVRAFGEEEGRGDRTNDLSRSRSTRGSRRRRSAGE